MGEFNLVFKEDEIAIWDKIFKLKNEIWECLLWSMSIYFDFKTHYKVKS
jgi:hypothetical protein